MGWFRVQLSEVEQQLVLDHRDGHIDRLVRQRMWALWLLHCGETRQKTAEILQVSRATVQRHFEAYRTGGLSRLARRGEAGTASEWTTFDERLKAEFRERPARSVAEAGERIKALTGLERRPTQVRHHLHRLGLEYRRMRAIPAPPPKKLAEHLAEQAAFVESKRQPALEAAQQGRGHVFFMDASHFVMGTFLCCLWCVARVFVKAAAGRQRLNVLGAWNAVTHELVSVINTATVNADTMCELL